MWTPTTSQMEDVSSVQAVQSQFSLCPTLCDPIDYSRPGFLVHHQLLEVTQTQSIESMMPSNHIILCCPLSSCLQFSSASGSFPMSQFFTSGGQRIGVPASTSVLPMNTQDRSPLGGTGWISLQSKDSQKSSPAPQFKSINSSVLSFLYNPTLTSILDHWKNHSFD